MFPKIQLFVLLALASAVCGKAASDGNAWQRIDDDNAAVSYSSDVLTGYDPSLYGGGFHYFNTPGDWCSVSFNGMAIRWIGGRNTDHGDADIYIDGKFASTVNTHASSWLKQQELYTKTGLADGPHTLKIQIKSAGYQDFDAFEYLGAPTAGAIAVAPIKIGQTVMPDQVSYLNPPHRYAIGSGVAMAVGNVAGDWSQMTGPGYTIQNMINSEQLMLEIDGDQQPLHFEMKRAAQTGIYYGVAARGDLRIVLVDYARSGQPWLARLLTVDNLSAATAHDVRVRAVINPNPGDGISHGLVLDNDSHCAGVFLRGAPLNGTSHYAGHHAIEASAVAAFADPGATAFRTGSVYTLETPLSRIAPKGSCQVTLCHYFHEANMPDSQCITAARAFDAGGELGKSIRAWQAWFANVPPAYRLSNIKDDRARTLVEGALSVIKTNQSMDGGFVANISFFREGFWRDTVLGLRAMGATGHFDELKRWLPWANHVFDHFGHIPDCASCMASFDDDTEIWDMGNTGVEGPAYVLLCARDYEAATHDCATLHSVDKMLRFCMEEQLRQAVANGDKLEFNGDETEVCGAVDITAAGTEMRIPAQLKDWSLSSVAICAASLDFFIKYIEECGENPAAYHSSLTGTTLNLHDQLAALIAAMDRDFWRTDVPEFPDGFHDSFRLKADGAWPKRRVANLCLMPVYFQTPCDGEKKAKDVRAVAHYFDAKTGFLQLVPGGDTGFDGHDLGYLLWGLVEIGDSHKEAIYQALVNGPTCDSWGSFNEAYDTNGVPNDHDLRTMESGVNVSAIAKYWKLGNPEKQP